APEFPAGCWHALLLPSHVSVVHGLPSSVHAVPLAFLASAGQAALLPVQLSATSHSRAAPRHTVLAEAKPSAGHVELAPVHGSATSQAPAAARHVVPALPAACWQVPLDPVHRSVVQTFPSSVQAVPLVLNVHVVVQHEAGLPLSAPVSHCSGLSTTPSPQSEK